MTITKKLNGSTLTISLEGRLDTGTAPQLEAELNSSLSGVSELIIDMEQLSYITSAGLRVLLAAQKIMYEQGEMVVRNVNDDIMEVFDGTGFSDVLTIE
ncbi:MAG: STAS domain-containing protein [Oscillibacter sp.]|nr:STAS domain-containing protein [Oscillibacter sp.]